MLSFIFFGIQEFSENHHANLFMLIELYELHICCIIGNNLCALNTIATIKGNDSEMSVDAIHNKQKTKLIRLFPQLDILGMRLQKAPNLEQFLV